MTGDPTYAVNTTAGPFPLIPSPVLITIPQGQLQEAWYVRGRIRPYPGEKCPKCGDPFASIQHPIIRKEQIDIICSRCLTRPKRFIIDGRGIRDRRGEVVGVLVHGFDGSPFYSFHSAHMLLSTIREESKKPNFDARAYQPERVRKYAVPRMAEEYVSALLRGGRGRGHYSQVERTLGVLAEATGERDCRTICGDDLLEMDKRFVREGLTGETRRKYLRTVQAFVRWFNAYHLPFGQRIEVPPIPLLPTDKKEPGWIDTPEQELVLAAIPFENLHLAFRILFATGARIGEVCGLKKKDLVRDEGIPGIYVVRNVTQYGKVKDTKTGKSFFKPLPESLFEMLERTCRTRFPEDFIFLTRYGNPYSPARLSTVWKQAATKVGLNIALYPAVRHSRVTRRIIELQKEWVRECGRTIDDGPDAARGYIRPIREKRNVRNPQGGRVND